MVVGLLFHSSRLAWTGTDQTNHRSSGAVRREAWCYRDRSVSRRSKLPQLSLYGIRTDVRIGRILRNRPSWNTSACLAPRIVLSGPSDPGDSKAPSGLSPKVRGHRLAHQTDQVLASYISTAANVSTQHPTWAIARSH